ncbi:hypothetical protein Clacol_000197 [Clathrus columnatus]|uniref:Uncharacterized protein n=1 Tax=Clathrus columnatus TaxID=1419009 RepID=A0AAV5A291_9AGAM|nr:hypothetical protein Clacol_000197 [Clathrus columnatus]
MLGSRLMGDSTEDGVHFGGGSALLEPEQSPGTITNSQSLHSPSATTGFNLFDLPLTNNSRHDIVRSSQAFYDANNRVFFGNQSDFDFGSPHVDENTLASYLPSVASNEKDKSIVDPSSAPITTNIVDLQYQMFIDLALDDLTSYAGFGQRLNAQMISMTGYAAEAVIPNVQMPSTSEASYDDRNRTEWPSGQMERSYNGNPPVQFPQTFQPSTSPRGDIHSTLFPTSDTTVPRIDNNENMNITSAPSSRKKRYSKKLLPSKSLYTLESGKYICRYKGPARPEGCSVKSGEIRYLCRHLRVHALKEIEMDITPEERVACNGVPEELLYLSVSCPFNKVANRGKCRYYRETGTIWKVDTLERWEKVMDRHKAEYHDTDSGS